MSDHDRALAALKRARDLDWGNWQWFRGELEFSYRHFSGTNNGRIVVPAEDTLPHLEYCELRGG